MPPNNSDSSWVQYQKLVLAELERHSEALENINRQIAAMNVDLAMLKVRAGVWGALAGLVPVVIAFAISKLK